MNDIGLNISLVVFYLSFAWLVTERIDEYPYLRRLSLLVIKRRKDIFKSPHFKVMVWGFSYLIFWIIQSSLSFYVYSRYLSDNEILSLLLGPVFYFIAPHLISGTTTALILWKVPNDPKLTKHTPNYSLSKSKKSVKRVFIGGFVGATLLVWLTPAILLFVS